MVSLKFLHHLTAVPVGLQQHRPHPHPCRPLLQPPPRHLSLFPSGRRVGVGVGVGVGGAQPLVLGPAPSLSPPPLVLLQHLSPPLHALPPPLQQCLQPLGVRGGEGGGFPPLASPPRLVMRQKLHHQCLVVLRPHFPSPPPHPPPPRQRQHQRKGRQPSPLVALLRQGQGRGRQGAGLVVVVWGGGGSPWAPLQLGRQRGRRKEKCKK